MTALGGGYQYRLQKLVQGSHLTESAFQQLPLEFDRTKQALLLNNGTRFPLPGVFVDKGTWPKGSTWARNPIPRQGEYSNGATRPNKTDTDAVGEFPLNLAFGRCPALAVKSASMLLTRGHLVWCRRFAGLGGIPAAMPMGLLGSARLPKSRDGEHGPRHTTEL